MKRSVPISLILFLALPAVHARILETIDAKVNDELILSGEVDARVYRYALDRKLTQMNDEQYQEVRNRILNAMIDQALITQEVKNRLSPEELERIRATVERQTNQEMAAFQSTLTTPQDLAQKEQSMGMTWEEYRQAQYRMNYDQYLNEVVAFQLARRQVERPTAQEIEEFQRTHPEAQPGGEVEIAHIQLNIPAGSLPEQEQAIRQKAEEIALRARSGEPFANLVAAFSQNEATRRNRGLLPPVKKGMLNPEFDIVFGLQPGDITDPIRTPGAYHIVQVQKKNDISDLVMQTKKQQIIEELIKGLRSKAKIEIRPRTQMSPVTPLDNP
ncbi:MAG: peptidylprolyl isomerase [bacterium]